MRKSRKDATLLHTPLLNLDVRNGFPWTRITRFSCQAEETLRMPRRPFPCCCGRAGGRAGGRKPHITRTKKFTLSPFLLSFLPSCPCSHTSVGACSQMCIFHAVRRQSWWRETQNRRTETPALSLLSFENSSRRGRKRNEIYIARRPAAEKTRLRALHRDSHARETRENET